MSQGGAGKGRDEIGVGGNQGGGSGGMKSNGTIMSMSAGVLGEKLGFRR